jgi:NADPH-dependent 2,4-dienoyl-CoA reductase/sulfur reductase-like enzyme
MDGLLGRIDESVAESSDKADFGNGEQPAVKRYAESGINILIVGAGIGGLLSALECWRKGHSVQVLERSSRPVLTGKLSTGL